MRLLHGCLQKMRRDFLNKRKKSKSKLKNIIRGYDESWHEINIEELVQWLFDEKLMKYDKKKQTFDLTPKGVFLLKFMSCYSPKTGVRDADQIRFHKFISTQFDWTWLWESVVKGDDIKK